MRKLETVSCSLNLGLIYSLNYSYTPENGISMTIFFVNETGDYKPPTLLPMNKANIKIGSASFGLYPKKYTVSKSAGRKVISVDFVDETFMLDNYYIILRGKGSGEGIFEIGAPVGGKTGRERYNIGLDEDAQKIKEFARFLDLEYNFNDLLNVIGKKFKVTVQATYDADIKRDVIGTFKEVLSDWCNYLNLAYYFENGGLKIYDPTKITIKIPQQKEIVDVLSYDFSEEIDKTRDKTVSKYFEQEGGEKNLNENAIESHTLYPIGYEFNLNQTMLDLNQVAAAAYGREFWFLYNFYYDTLSECGWTKKSSTLANNKIAEIDEKLGDDNFQAYSNYANIAGRFYLSNRLESLDLLKDTTWYSEAEGQIFNINSELAKERAIQVMFLDPPNISSTYQIEGTPINNKFKGINYVGKRMAYFDAKDDGRIAALTLSEELRELVVYLYEQLITPGTNSVKLNGIQGINPSKHNVIYNFNSMPQQLITEFEKIKNGDKKDYLKPRYSSYAIKGARTGNVVNRRDLENQPSQIAPVAQTLLGQRTNTSAIKTRESGTQVVYYDKHTKSSSQASFGGYYKRYFDIEKISEDNIIQEIFSKDSNTYRFTRNFASIDALLNSPHLKKIAQSSPFTLKTASFSVNYYYNVPTNFLSSGLIGIDMSYTDNGLTCAYTFSNSMLVIPEKKNEVQRFLNSIKNSTLRKYYPSETITEK